MLGHTDDPDSSENYDDEQLRTEIEQQTALVGPILNELFAKGAVKDDYWLKGASTRILSDWIIGLQNMATLFQQQLEAAGQVIGAQEEELQQLRPQKKKVWTPGVN